MDPVKSSSTSERLFASLLKIDDVEVIHPNLKSAEAIFVKAMPKPKVT
jgi:hypothetical protein